ncbi:MAG: hypothetical protein DRI30_08170 [Chloroflexi bacterium]|nr:MAG: hypothetical protein DRI30_08170 [Chloroflexota bacterium]
MFDHIDFAVVDLEVSRKFYQAVLATLGIEPFMDIKTEEGREGTGYGSLNYAAFMFDLDGHTIEAVCHHAI